MRIVSFASLATASHVAHLLAMADPQHRLSNALTDRYRIERRRDDFARGVAYARERASEFAEALG